MLGCLELARPSAPVSLQQLVGHGLLSENARSFRIMTAVENMPSSTPGGCPESNPANKALVTLTGAWLVRGRIALRRSALSLRRAALV